MSIQLCWSTLRFLCCIVWRMYSYTFNGHRLDLLLTMILDVRFSKKNDSTNWTTISIKQMDSFCLLLILYVSWLDYWCCICGGRIFLHSIKIQISVIRIREKRKQIFHDNLINKMWRKYRKSHGKSVK